MLIVWDRLWEGQEVLKTGQRFYTYSLFRTNALILDNLRILAAVNASVLYSDSLLQQERFENEQISAND